jgi:hypothetical protein
MQKESWRRRRPSRGGGAGSEQRDVTVKEEQFRESFLLAGLSQAAL